MVTKTTSLWVWVFLCAFTAATLAGIPVAPPSYNELLDKSDLVCVVQVIRIAESPKPHPKNPYPETVKSYVATCKVMGVFKGDAPKDDIRIPFYGRLFDPPVHFAAPLVETTQEKHEWVQYLAFLKRGKDGVFVPATGDEDAGFCFRVLFTSVDVDVWKILQQRQMPQKKSDAANQSRSLPSETN